MKISPAARRYAARKLYDLVEVLEDEEDLTPEMAYKLALDTLAAVVAHGLSFAEIAAILADHGAAVRKLIPKKQKKAS